MSEDHIYQGNPLLEAQAAELLANVYFKPEHLDDAVRKMWGVRLDEITSETTLPAQISAVARTAFADQRDLHRLFGHLDASDWRRACIGFLLQSREKLGALNIRSSPATSVFLYCLLGKRDRGSPVSLHTFAGYKEVIAGCVKQAGSGEMIADEPDGTLYRFEGATKALQAALLIQQAIHSAGSVPTAPESLPIRLGMHPASSGDSGRDHTAEIAKQIAAICDPGQILTSTGVRDLYNENDIDPRLRSLKWQYHGDYALRSGGIRDLHEVADPAVRTPHVPAAPPDSIAMPASKHLEDKGYTQLSRVSRNDNTILYKAMAHEGGKSRAVAIKIFFDFNDDDDDRKEFLDRAQAVSSLKSESIVNIISIQKSNIPYIVMEWLDGDHFDIAFNKLNSFDEKLSLSIKLVEAVKYAHSKGVLHGDIKPSNIIVVGAQPVLLDFGQLDWAKNPTGLVEQSYRLAGTARYVAPELASKLLPISFATDIYSLGMILYESFVGRLPFPYQSREDILNAHINVDPELPSKFLPDFNQNLERVILKAIEKRPAQDDRTDFDTRYKSTTGMLSDLQRVADGKRVKARPSVYNNAMQARAKAAVSQIEDWSKDAALTDSEYARLRRAYEPLLRTGISAVAESRLTHVHIVFLYFFGALLLSGVASILSLHGSEFGVWFRSLAGLSLPLSAAGIWYFLRRIGRHRGAFVFGLITLSSLPIAVTNTIHEINNVTLNWPAVTALSGKSIFAGTAVEADTIARVKGDEVNLGNNSSDVAHDGTCQDPRFDGPNVAGTYSGYMADAQDCLSLIDKGKVSLRPAQNIEIGGATVDLGVDDSPFALDNRCDDARFVRSSEVGVLRIADIGKDASDCASYINTATESGDEIQLDTEIATLPPGAVLTAEGTIDLGVDKAPFGLNALCEDPRFVTGLAGTDDALNKDADDCSRLLKNGEIQFGDQSADEANRGEIALPDGRPAVRYLNWQMAIGLIFGLVWAEIMSARSRTRTVSIVASVMVALIGLVALDFWGWKYLVLRPNWNLLAIGLFGIAASCLLYARFARGTWARHNSGNDPLNQSGNFNRLAVPAINVAMVFGVVGFTMLSLSAPDELPALTEQIGWWGVVAVALALSAMAFYLFGMWIRTKLFVDGIVGYSSLIFLALLYVAIGFLFFDSPQFREEELIPALKIYPNMQGKISVFAFVFLATIIFFLYRSVLLNSRSVMSYTLAALVFFLWYVEIIYFERSVAWAVSLIVAGLLGLLFILARLASQGSNDDIDDVVTPVPRKTTASNTGKSTLLS